MEGASSCVFKPYRWNSRASVRGGQRPDTENFVLMQGFQSGLCDGGDGNGFTKRIKYFDGIAVLAVWRTVMIDNFYQVSATQAVFWNVTSKSSVSIEFEAHSELSFRN